MFGILSSLPGALSQSFCSEQVGEYSKVKNSIAVKVLPNCTLVLDDLDGLHSLDMSDPSNPTQLGILTGATGNAFDTSKTDAFIIDWSDLKVVHFADPKNLTLRKKYENIEGRGIKILGNESYIVGSLYQGGYGLEIDDISNPDSITNLGKYSSLRGSPQSLVVSAKKVVYIAAGIQGQVIIDGKNSANPVFKSEFV
ncbi:MAG: hypothetical protein K1060chlam4_01375, partial [Candidatus Anoxychlamydiales bacterium]|nr:hypothetical protein [Candidatus Anoxychlamydiales bacterium]